jgi:hypothetical protein
MGLPAAENGPASPNYEHKLDKPGATDFEPGTAHRFRARERSI